MPTVLEETRVSLERADLRARSPIARRTNKGKILAPPRTAGIHLSGVLIYIAKEGMIMRNLEEIDEELLPLRMACGIAWEEFCVTLYPDIDWQPGEVTEQGVVMTCDGLTPGQLEEFKFTWKKVKSAEELLRESWYWLNQGRGYCWGYSTQTVRWHVCYCNGDYRGSGPIYMRYRVRFDEEEIQKTARMILLNRDRAIERGYAE